MGLGLGLPRSCRGIISPSVTWQLTQVVLSGCGLYIGDTCEYRAGTHPIVRWHASHERAVMKWPDDFPVAEAPL